MQFRLNSQYDVGSSVLFKFPNKGCVEYDPLYFKWIYSMVKNKYCTNLF